MKRIIIILIFALFCLKGFSQFRFPSTDSLHRYTNRFITNSAINAFTDYRMNTLLNGIINWIDSARLGTGGSVGVDTIYALNDSTIRYKKNGVTFSFNLRGRYWTLQQVLGNGSTLTSNNTITLADSLTFASGKIVVENLRVTNAQIVDDSTNYKPVVVDINNNVFRSQFWNLKNISNSSLTWNGDYIQNVNNFNLHLDSIDFGLLASRGTLSGRKVVTSFALDADDSGGNPFRIFHGITKVGSLPYSNDSITLLTRYFNNQIDLIATNLTANNRNATFTVGQDGSAGMISTGGNPNNVKGLITDTAEIRFKNATTASDADSIAGYGAWDPVTKSNPVYKIPKSAVSGTISQPSQQIVYGTGPSVTSEAAFNYNPSTNKLNADSVKTLRLKTDSAARLGARSVVGQDEPSYTWQRSDQWYADGAYPGIFTVVNTDSVNCVACTPGQAISVSDSTNGRGLVIATYSESTGGNFIRTMKARGNWKTPTALKNGDILTGWGAWGYGSTKFSGSAVGFHFAATEDFTDASWGTEIQFFTTPNGSTGRTYNQIMKQDGSTLFGGTIDAPTINISGTGSRFLTVNSTDGGATFARFQRSGSTKAVFGTASTADQFITGSVANDFIMRAGESGGSGPANILFSVDGATTTGGIATDGTFFVGSSSGSAGFAADASGTTILKVKAPSATNANFQLYNPSTNDNLPMPYFYPNQGTNSGLLMRLVPRGTGFSSTLKAGIDIFNTDAIADGSNFDLFRIMAAGTAYTFNSFKVGSGTTRPISIQTDGTERLGIAVGGGITMSSLSGSGTRMVTADASGVLSTTTIPAADGNGIYTGSGTLSGTTTVSGSGTSSLLLGASGSKLAGLTVWSADGIALFGNLTYAIDDVTADANYTVPAAKQIIEVSDNLTTNRTFTMPSPGAQGQTLTVVMRFSAGSNHFNLASAITDNSTGSTFTQLDWGKTYDFYVDRGTTWRLIRKY